MIFSELYCAYYNTVAKVLGAAVGGGLDKDRLRRIIEENAFAESALEIEPALTEQKWQLLLPNGRAAVRHIPTMPLTTLEKRWLKAIYLDPRVRLFTDEIPETNTESGNFRSPGFGPFPGMPVAYNGDGKGRRLRFRRCLADH